MAEKRRNYGDEFKREAVRLVTEAWLWGVRNSPESRHQSEYAGPLEA
jgi:hypothetical protein